MRVVACLWALSLAAATGGSERLGDAADGPVGPTSVGTQAWPHASVAADAGDAEPSADDGRTWMGGIWRGDQGTRPPSDFASIVGSWQGELATFILQPSGELELMGGGVMIDLQFWRDAPVGQIAGEYVLYPRGFDHPRRCLLERGIDAARAYVFSDLCEGGGTLLVHTHGQAPELRFTLRPAEGREQIVNRGYGTRRIDQPAHE